MGTTPVNAAPDLAVSKSDGGASVVPGTSITYTLSYANTGNQDAIGVVLRHPPLVRFLPASPCPR